MNRALTIGFVLSATITPIVHAQGFFLLDFGTRTGEAEGWDIIDEILADQQCDYLGNNATPCTTFQLTDKTGVDNDVTLEILEFPFIGNTAPFLSEVQFYDGIEVPLEALGDYQYRDPRAIVRWVVIK